MSPALPSLAGRALTSRRHAFSRTHAPATDAEQFAEDFVTLDGLIDGFMHALAPVTTAPDAPTASKLLLVHTLACVASNQLHKRFRQGDAPIANKDYAAAISVTTALDALDPAQVGFVNPIFAVRRRLQPVCVTCSLTPAHLIRFFGRLSVGH